MLITLIIKKIQNKEHRLSRRWNKLKLVFYFLALDEALQIHEILIIPSLKPNVPALLTNIWVIPYGLLAIIASIYFRELILSFPKKIKRLTLLAGSIYLTGALGMEILGSYLVRTGDIRLHGISYGLICTLEEAMEISGVIIFIYALLIYIFIHQKQKLKVNFRLTASK